MIKKYFVFIFLLLTIHYVYSNTVQLSTYAKVSIITVGPGEKIYEQFGHSAIRIKDTVLNFDYIYNYGIFDFEAPHFEFNFAKGRMLYKLAAYPFQHFKEGYKKDKRWMKEQELNLTQEQKQAFFNYLYNNAQPRNARYQYDPFFENCATKMPSVTDIITENKISFSEDYAIENQSFRQLMNSEIHWNTWGSFGINIALGSKLDKKATAKQYMYLPDYVYEAFKGAEIYINNQPQQLVKKENTILDFAEIESKSDKVSPLLIFCIILLLGIYLSYRDYKNNTRSKWFDFLLFLSTGIIGCVVVFLWFFTDHSTTPNNFNFLWAFAPNLIVAFFLIKNNPPQWIQKYLYFLLILLAGIPIIWLAKIQLFALSSIPIFILLFIRYYLLARLNYSK